MAKIRRLQSSLVAGELDPKFAFRSDLEQYYNGAEILRDVLPLTQGGVTRRPGLKYVAPVNDNDEARMVPFQFNLEQKYLFTFTEGRLEVRTSPEDVLVDTLTGAPISNITEAMLPALSWAQSADTLLLFHPDLQTIQITRTGASTFAASHVAYVNIPAHAYSGVTVTTPAATLTPDSTTGEVTLTAGSSVFIAGHVGQFIAINDGLVYITGYTSGTVVTGYVRIELKNTDAAASGDWELETGYEAVISVTRGWPRSGTFHEDRLYLGGLKQRPQTVLGSKVGEFFDFDEGALRDGDAINATLSTGQLNAINNIVSGRTLQVFTVGGEFSVPRSDLLDPITPKNISFLQQTNHGCTSVRQVGVDGSTIFYDGKDFREFIFNDVEQSYVSPSLNLLATHIINNVVGVGLRRSTSASNASYLFAVNGDGTVAVLNSLRSQNITAWVQWTTVGLFKDICTVGDTVYFIVERTIDGSPVRYHEKLDDSLKLDCALKSTGPASDTWAGYNHLGSETVSAFGNDFVIPDIELDAGEGVTDEDYTSVEFGFPFYCRVKSMPFAGTFYGEDVTAKMKRLVKVWLGVRNTRNILVNGYRPALIDMEDAMDQVPSLYTGTVGVPLGGYDRLAQVDITQEEPTEFTLDGFVTEVGIGR
jgi:hypothetical protein